MPSKKLTKKGEKKAVEKIVFTSLSVQELEEKAKKLWGEINKMGMQIKVGRVRNVRAKYNLSKERARVLTVLSAKMANNHEKS